MALDMEMEMGMGMGPDLEPETGSGTLPGTGQVAVTGTLLLDAGQLKQIDRSTGLRSRKNTKTRQVQRHFPVLDCDESSGCRKAFSFCVQQY